jgi:hypothetical protein
VLAIIQFGWIFGFTLAARDHVSSSTGANGLRSLSRFLRRSQRGRFSTRRKDSTRIRIQTQTLTKYVTVRAESNGTPVRDGRAGDTKDTMVKNKDSTLRYTIQDGQA